MSAAPDTELTLEMLHPDPMDHFTHWFQDAVERSGLNDPNAMCLSTLSPEGVPEGRIVLLKGVDPRGFAFYTNLESAKGRALAAHPVAALTFHWDRLARQVRVQGGVERVTDEEADAYYASRPRGSRLGAWASEQSRPLVDRATLEGRVQEMEGRYPGEEIPRPPHWSGFRLLPVAVEFWQGRTSRLHDRFVYRKDSGGGWTIQRLNP